MIQIDSLSKNYPTKDGELFALKKVNIAIEKGDIFGLIGKSGAGKSTLIRILAGLVSPTSGAIFFYGKNAAFSRDMHLGMIFQHFNLLSSRTVAGNIAFPLEIKDESSEKRVDELLMLVGLTSKKHAYPSQLSGGEKQRVGIARALATRPDILLCDEATSALDPATTKEILDLLKQLNQDLGLTIFLITHEMEVIRRICNKVAVMESGQIVEQGLVSDVFFQPKQSITKAFLQNATHELPQEYFQIISPERKLLRLSFKGKAAGEPIIARMIQNFGVEANILLGWIDHFQTTTIGNLIIELNGKEEKIAEALNYLNKQSISYEVLEK